MREGDAERATAGGETANSFPAGAYRADITEGFLLKAGVDGPSAYDNAGIWTLTFEKGEFNAGYTSPDGKAEPPDNCPGSTYSVEGSRVTVRLGQGGPGCGSAAGQVLFSASWTVQGDQLRFQEVRWGTGLTFS